MSFVPKYKVGDRVIVNSRAYGSAVLFRGQIVELLQIDEDDHRVPYWVGAANGSKFWVSPLEIEEAPVATPQVGDRCYCTEPGHPAKGMLVTITEVPYLYDSARVAGEAASGARYHFDPAHLVPAHEAKVVPAPAQSTKPCPDCAHTSHPGQYTGFSGFPEPCGTCQGSKVAACEAPIGTVQEVSRDGKQAVIRLTNDNAMALLSVGAKVRFSADYDAPELRGRLGTVTEIRDRRQENGHQCVYVDVALPIYGQHRGHRAESFELVIDDAETTCRTWPADPADPLKVGDLVAGLTGSGCVSACGKVVGIDGSDEYDLRVDVVWVHTKSGVRLGADDWTSKYVHRWNGIAP